MPRDLWAADLAALARSGLLSDRVLADLPFQEMGGHGGSWLDPLFKGPAPIAEVQGLGERYVQLQFLGEGAGGTVFKALDTLLLRWVALKVLKGDSPHALGEARAQAQVEHPNVCRVYEVGRGFITMQLVEGPTLAAAGPTLDLRSKVACLRQVALGVDAAHRRGLLHLDLKPGGNILLHPETDGTLTPIVTDFGMVVDRAEGVPDVCPMGTPPYSSPEQLAGDPGQIGPTADVYALGVLAYVLLGGASPYQASTLEQLLVEMVKTQPVPLGHRAPRLPRDLVRLVHRCLEKQPERRYPSAGEVAEELDRFLHKRPLVVMGKALPYRFLRCLQRNRLASWILVLGLGAVGLSLTLGFWREARIAQRTDWDRHFQKRVEEVRVDLERAYRRPIHDIRPELDHIRTAMDGIREEMVKQGRVTEGPGHLALGQLLVLQDARSDEAARHFQTAWDAGLHTEGARTWLAFAHLRLYEDTLRAAQNQQVAGGAFDRGAAQDGHLEAARSLLKGRGDTDQARLMHMADLMEARLGAAEDSPGRLQRQLDLAIAYRKRAPQDLDAILEETDARFELVEAWSKEHPNRRPEDLLARQRKELERCLEEGRSVAPSHPRIYLRLAQTCQLQVEWPSARSAPRAPLHAAWSRWIGQGLRVNPEHPALQMARIEHLSWEGLQERRPLLAVHAGMRRILDEAVASRQQVIFGILLHVARAGVMGRDLLPFGMEVLSSQQRSLEEPALPVYASFLMSCAFLQGKDPGRYQAGPPAKEPLAAWGLAMLEAEWSLSAGRASDVDLERIQALQDRVDSRAPGLDSAALAWSALCCRIRGGREDWGRLEAAFQALEGVRRSNELWGPILEPRLVAGMALADHARAEGRDPGPYLAKVEAWQSRMEIPNPVGDYARAVLLARLRLCAARNGLGDPERIEKAIDSLGPMLEPKGPRLAFADLPLMALMVPGRGPLLRLRGELGLELAAGRQGPTRSLTARKAAADLQAAIAKCPDFRDVLEPRLQEVRRLSLP